MKENRNLAKKLLITSIILTFLFGGTLISVFFDPKADIESYFIILAIVCIPWAVFISVVVKNSKIKKVENEGEFYTARFIAYTSVEENYKIVYSWEDKSGHTYQQKSDNVYSFKQAEVFRRKQTVGIKAIGKYSVIIENPVIILLEEEESKNKETKIACQYCGSAYESDQVKCPYCGANTKVKHK